MRGIFLALLVISSLIFVACGSSRRTTTIEEGWELLGQQKVNFVRDVDMMEVTSENKHTAIQFRVEDKAIHLNGLKIYFTNGDKLEPSLDDVIEADTNSRVIDISEEGRTIDKIEFRYRTTGNVLRGRANVLVLGKKSRYY